MFNDCRQLKKAASVAFFVILISLLTGCGSEGESFTEWTFFIYMAADNGLNESAVSVINDLEEADIPQDVRIILQIDESKDYTRDSGAKRYKIVHDESQEVSSEKLDDLGEINSADWHELSKFINWGTGKFPSKHYGTVIWAHGNGWREGKSRSFGIDYDVPGQSLPAEISLTGKDLNNAVKSLRKNQDLLIADMCNMLSFEFIGELENKFRYVLGSGELIPVFGFPYDEIFSDWINFNGLENKIEFAIEAFSENASLNFSDFLWSIAAVDLTRKNEVFSEINAFLDRHDYFSGIEERYSAFEQLSYSGIPNFNSDFYQYFYNIKEISLSEDGSNAILADTMLTFGDDLIKFHKQDNHEKGFRSVAVFLPPIEIDASVESSYENLNWPRETGWLNFIERYLAEKP